MLQSQAMFPAKLALRYGCSRSMNIRKALSAHQYLHSPAFDHTRHHGYRHNQAAGLVGGKYSKYDRVNQSHLTRHAQLFGGAPWYIWGLGMIGVGSGSCPFYRYQGISSGFFHRTTLPRLSCLHMCMIRHQ